MGVRCLSPSRPYAGTFTVLDINGVHEVQLQFCDCESKQNLFLQVLRFGWFPATVKFPRTAITLRALKFFHILSFEAKTTVFEFSNTLRRITDNTGTMIVRVRTLLATGRAHTLSVYYLSGLLSEHVTCHTQISTSQNAQESREGPR